jgi:hypothetical protein
MVTNVFTSPRLKFGGAHKSASRRNFNPNAAPGCSPDAAIWVNQPRRLLLFSDKRLLVQGKELISAHKCSWDTPLVPHSCRTSVFDDCHARRFEQIACGSIVFESANTAPSESRSLALRRHVGT